MDSRRGRPTAAERDRRREAILDAAITRFTTDGYGATSIEALASDAGVTKRTIYSWFGDLAGVLTAAVERQHGYLLAAADEDGEQLSPEDPASNHKNLEDAATNHKSLEHAATNHKSPEDAASNHNSPEDAATNHKNLEDAATRLVIALHSDVSVALHRLVIAESQRFPAIAAAFYAAGPARSIAFLGSRVGPVAEQLYTLLLGEPHRRRLLGLTPAPTEAAARTHARNCLELLAVGGY